MGQEIMFLTRWIKAYPALEPVPAVKLATQSGRNLSRPDLWIEAPWYYCGVMSQYSLEIANFSDYRDFLFQRFTDLKNKSKTFSLQACAKKSLVSKSHLQFLFQKKRHISHDKIPTLARALRLSPEEEYFLFLMVCKNISRSTYVKKHFEAILGRLRHQSIITQTPEPPLSPGDHSSLINDVVAFSLHRLVRLKGFEEDLGWILKNLKIPGLTKERVRITMRSMERDGVLTRDKEGKLKSEDIFWRPDPLQPDQYQIYKVGAENVAHLLTIADQYRPSVYMVMSLCFDEKHLLKAEREMIELHHRLKKFEKESENPTATVFTGNFFMTLARLGAQ